MTDTAVGVRGRQRQLQRAYLPATTRRLLVMATGSVKHLSRRDLWADVDDLIIVENVQGAVVA